MKTLPRWTITVVLLLMFGLAVHSLVQKSPTFDEQGFLVRGLAYVRDENRWMRVGHPAGLNSLNAFFLAGDDTILLPTEDASWLETRFHRPAELFMWEIGNRVEKIMFLGRMPSVFLGMLLVCVIGRFSFHLTKQAWAATFAATLVALDPNILAHTRLATTDLGLVAGAVLATYLLWRFLKKPSVSTVILAGFGFGLLQNTKFTSGLFVPLFTLLILIALITHWRLDGAFPARMLLLLIVGYPVAGFLTLWASYGFEVGTLPETLPVLSDVLGGRTLPLAHHIEQLSDLGGRMAKRTPAFLSGNFSDSGWWYYFPAAVAFKTPIPLLLLGMVGLLVLLFSQQRKRLIDNAALLVPFVGFFAIAMTNDINIGYRHILLVVPFFALLASLGFGLVLRQNRPNFTLALVILVGWFIVETISIGPHFLAYFNQLAGGPDGGWQHLVDSNIDWGQDLAALAAWQDENNIDELRLSFFGEGRPDYYGIEYVGLPSFPPRLMSPDAVTHAPLLPLAGTYAISVTNLQGVMFGNHDLFAHFRDLEPIASIGHSILIYDVAQSAESVHVSLGSVNIDQLNETDLTAFGSNALDLHWFDAQTAVIVPDQLDSWVVSPPNQLATTKQWSFLYSWGEPYTSYDNYTLFRQNVPFSSTIRDLNWPAVNTIFEQGDHQIELANLLIEKEEETVFIYSLWRQIGPPTNLKLFVHLNGADPQPLAQWDGFGAVWHGWDTDTWLLQVSEIGVSAENLTAADPSPYNLFIGVYNPATGQRWQPKGVDTDRLPIGEVVLP